jgi:cbb3-type cytochrome oxidase maturation protein
MSVIFILICFSLLVAIGFLFAFIWAVKTGQYHDTYTPSVRMLFDEKNTQTVSSLKEEGRDDTQRKQTQNPIKITSTIK